MNYIDGIVLAVLALCVFTTYKKGLVLSLFNLVSWVIGLILTNLLYPFASKMLRESFLYTNIQKSVARSFGFDSDTGVTAKIQNELINALSVPDFLKRSLLENNNSEIHTILKVSGIEDYITGYIANMLINAIAMIGVFIIVMILLRVISISLNIITKLPVLHSMDKVGGAFVGVLQGTLVIWLGMVFSVLFFAQADSSPILNSMESSLLAIHFYNNNLILEYILKIFG